MKAILKLCVGVMIMITIPATVKSQAAAGFTATATIVNPVGLNGLANNFTALLVNGEGDQNKNKTIVIAASFKVDAAETYSISVPGELALRNGHGGSCIAASLDPQVVTGPLSGGQQMQLKTELVLDKGLPKTKHSSAPYELTLNFN